MTQRRFRARPSAVVVVILQAMRHPANRERRVRSLAHLARCEIWARTTGQPVVTPLGGRSKTWAHLHSGGSWRVVRANPPDWAEMRVWRSWLREGDLFVDVGAHAGLYSIWAIDAGAHVVAVEPNPVMVRQLERNLALNGYWAEVVEAALWNAPGTMRLVGDDLLRQHLVPTAPRDGWEPGEEVQVSTLDAVLGGRHARGVKIDVEGAERLVIEGGTEALRERRIDLLQLEWNRCSAALLGEDRMPIVSLLREHGYGLVRPDASGNFHPVPDYEYGPDIFARPDS